MIYIEKSVSHGLGAPSCRRLQSCTLLLTAFHCSRLLWFLLASYLNVLQPKLNLHQCLTVTLAQCLPPQIAITTERNSLPAIWIEA